MRTLTAIFVAAVWLGGSALVGQQPAAGQSQPAGPLLVPSQETSPSVAPVAASAAAESSKRAASTPAAGSFFSIVGAVQYPGTYSSPHAQTLLSDLIDRAGGLNQDAAGTVRILDNRRSDQFAYSKSMPPVRIAAGSVVVVESRRSGPHRPSADGATVTDVVCLNLLDRPVVLFLTPGYESLARVLESLGQSQQAQSAVRIVNSQRGLATGRSMLSSGTVLVFDPASVDRTALARVAQHLQRDVQPLDESDAVQTPSAEVMDALQLLRRGMTTAEESSAAPRTTEGIPQPGLLPKRTLPDPVVVERSTGPALEHSGSGDPTAVSRIDTSVPKTTPHASESLPEQEESTAGSSDVASRAADYDRSRTQLPSEQHSPAEPRVAAMSGLTAPETARSTSPDPPKRADTAGPRKKVPHKTPRTTTSIALSPPASKHSKRSRSSLVRLGGIALGTGILAAICLLGAIGWAHLERRRRRRAKRPPVLPAAGLTTGRAADAAPPTAAQTPLDELINNAMPLIEEETVLPDDLKFHGQLVGHRYLLHSEPHALRGPHFASRQQSTPRETVAVSREIDATPPPTGADRRGAGRREVGPLERALRAATKTQQPENVK